MPVWLIIILTGAVSGAIFSVYNGDDGEICVETTVFAFVRTIIERVIMFFIFISILILRIAVGLCITAVIFDFFKDHLINIINNLNIVCKVVSRDDWLSFGVFIAFLLLLMRRIWKWVYKEDKR